MRRFIFCTLFLWFGLTTSAYAWFFFFIPGSVTRTVGDAITGAKGTMCVKEGIEVGHIFTSPNGNTAKVLSLSGTSSICKNPAQPIRADIEFTYGFASKAGIDLSDDFKPTNLTDFERFNGFLLKATSNSIREHGIEIYATNKNPTLSVELMANNTEQKMLANPKITELKSQNAELLPINGSPASRREITGKMKGVFGSKITWLYTILEGDNEFVGVIVYAPTDYFEQHREELQLYATRITGIRSTTPTVESPPQPVAAESQLAVPNQRPAPALEGLQLKQVQVAAPQPQASSNLNENQLPSLVSESDWKTIENSELYRNSPKPKAVTVNLTKSVTAINGVTTEYSEHIEITPIGNKCFRKHTQSVSTLRNTDSVDYYCGVMIQLGSEKFPLKDYQISGSLFPIHIGAEQQMGWSARSWNCHVVRKLDAQSLHPQLTGHAWAVNCLPNFGANKFETEHYYLEDIGMMSSVIGQVDLSNHKWFIPKPGDSTVMGLPVGGKSAPTTVFNSYNLSYPTPLPVATSPPSTTLPARPDPVSSLKTLKSMLDQGLITKDDYQAKKKIILDSM